MTQQQQYIISEAGVLLLEKFKNRDVQILTAQIRSRPAPQQPVLYAEKPDADDPEIIQKIALCLCEQCKVNGFLCQKSPRAISPEQPPFSADAVLGAYIADILEAVKIMRSESATVKGDANKTREKVYHDGALFAYDRMQQYLERKAALRARGTGK